MKRVMLIGLVALAVVLAGCTVQFSDSPVTGTIGSMSFTFVDGYVDADGFVEMYDEAKDFSDWTTYTDTVPQLMFTFPALDVGQYELKLDIFDLASTFTVTGWDGTTNSIYSDGYVEITGVTASEITGGMYIDTGDGTLDGTFTLERVTW